MVKQSSENQELSEPLNPDRDVQMEEDTNGHTNGESNGQSNGNGVRQRKNKQDETSQGYTAKMKVGMDRNDTRKKEQQRNRIKPTFFKTIELAARVGAACIIASAIQTRENPNQDVTTGNHEQKWVLFPYWYYLGGLSFCAVAVIFAAGENLGATMMEVCHAFFGVGLALVYNIILFSIVNVELYDPNNEDFTGYYQIDKTFTGSDYKIHLDNFYTVLPWIMVFVVVIVVLPINSSTKKFSLAYDLYFSLTIVNPSNPLNGSELKLEGDWYFDTPNTLKNLAMYFVVGLLGWVLSLVIMMIPYPRFAIWAFKKHMAEGAEEIMEILNLIVDAYCFKKKSAGSMKFLKAKLERKFEAATARHERMTTLLGNAWWEQIFLLNYILNFNRSMLQSHLHLLTTLLADLRALNFALEQESYDELHFRYMQKLRRDVHVMQLRSGDVLDEITANVRACTMKMDMQSVPKLDEHMKDTLRHFYDVNKSILGSGDVTAKDLADNQPLYLFFFSLHSFSASLTSFQDKHNKTNYTVGERLENFFRNFFMDFVNPEYYDRIHMVSSLKVAIAICIGVFLAVYVFNFSSTAPGAVAYVMGNHIGGAFSTTVNRVGGVVAGCVIPSILQFFIAQVCDPRYLNIVLMNALLFVWVTLSMYVRFSSSYWWYGGLVSAFVSAGILLRQTHVCINDGGDPSSVATSSYSSLAQNSVGVVLFILMELLVFPESSLSLLRKNIKKTLDKLESSFNTLFSFHMNTDVELDQKKLDEVKDILQNQLPGLLSKQKGLMQEASHEPALWKAPFSKERYGNVHSGLQRLLDHNNLMYKLMRWYAKRVNDANTDTDGGEDIRDDKGPQDDTRDEWKGSTHEFLNVVEDTFDSLDTVFSNKYLTSGSDQTAMFLQMKEAFREADVDGSGEIDRDEVEHMLKTVFSQADAASNQEIEQHVDEFMQLVDQNNDGKVSFDEFMTALENGLEVHTELYEKNASDSKNPSDGEKQDGANENRQGGGEPMRHEHDVLNVSEFSINQSAKYMRSAFVRWLVKDHRYEKVTLEELLLFNCLVGGSKGIAEELTKLQETIVSD